MSKWARTTVRLDLKIEDGESFQSVLRDLLEGLSQGDPSVARVLDVKAELVEDYDPEPTEAAGCPCRNVIG